MLGLSLAFLACRTPRRIVRAKGPEAGKLSLAAVMDSLAVRRLDYHYLSAKLKLEARGPDGRLRFVGNLRLQRDSLIWLNFKKASVEGLRVRISPQTVEILNHQENEYLKRPLQTWLAEQGLALSFGELQDLLLGQAFLLQGFDFQVKPEEKNQYLLGKRGQDQIELWLDGQKFALERLEVDWQRNNLDAEFDEFEWQRGAWLPLFKRLKLETEQGQKFQLEMEMRDLDWETTPRFPFTPPDHYKRI